MSRHTIPLIFKQAERSRYSDAAATIQNMYIERENDATYLKKRPGLDYIMTTVNTYYAIGLYPSNQHGTTSNETYYLYWDGSAWDIYGTDNGKIVDVPSFTNDDNNYEVFWLNAGYDGTYIRIVVSFNNGATFMWDETSATIVEITDAQFPGSKYGLVYLDDYLFASDGRYIYNSTNDDPTAWAAADIIAPQIIAPNSINRIFLHNNHVVAMGTNAIEFFYDAGNPSASVLAPRRDRIISDIGLWVPHFTGFISTSGPAYKNWVDLDYGKSMAFISYKPTTGSLGIHILENFQVKKISDDRIDKYLHFSETTNQRYPLLSSTTINGKVYPVFTHREYRSASETAISFVYDIEQNTWYEWTVDTNIHATGAMQIVSSVPYQTNSDNAERPQGNLVQFIDGKVYYLDNTLYQDEDSGASNRSITSQVITPKFRGGDGQKNLNKFQKYLHIVGDRGSSANAVTVSTSDDDYQSWDSHGTLDVSDAENSLYGLGRFRERAYKLSHTANLDLRLEALEIDVTAGVN